VSGYRAEDIRIFPDGKDRVIASPFLEAAEEFMDRREDVMYALAPYDGGPMRDPVWEAVMRRKKRSKETGAPR
jgi:hypothetical protein